jgi:hypothetical protein
LPNHLQNGFSFTKEAIILPQPQRSRFSHSRSPAKGALSTIYISFVYIRPEYLA